MNVNVMMQYVTYGLALIGVLAFLVSIIVQVIKELPGLNKIPTSIVALGHITDPVSGGTGSPVHVL